MHSVKAFVVSPVSARFRKSTAVSKCVIKSLLLHLFTFFFAHSTRIAGKCNKTFFVLWITPNPNWRLGCSWNDTICFTTLCFSFQSCHVFLPSKLLPTFPFFPAIRQGSSALNLYSGRKKYSVLNAWVHLHYYLLVYMYSSCEYTFILKRKT